MTEGQPWCSCCILKWGKLSGSSLGERDCAVPGRQAEVRSDLWLLLSDRNCKYMFFAKIHLCLPVLGSLAAAKVCYSQCLAGSGWGFGRGKRGECIFAGGAYFWYSSPPFQQQFRPILPMFNSVQSPAVNASWLVHFPSWLQGHIAIEMTCAQLGVHQDPQDLLP